MTLDPNLVTNPRLTHGKIIDSRCKHNENIGDKRYESRVKMEYKKNKPVRLVKELS